MDRLAAVPYLRPLLSLSPRHDQPHSYLFFNHSFIHDGYILRLIHQHVHDTLDV